MEPVKKLSHDDYVQQCQTNLVAAFQNANWHYEVPLDGLITYGHNKEFLSNICGYNHWNELPRENKKGILTRWQHMSYPDWDSVEVKSYDNY